MPRRLKNPRSHSLPRCHCRDGSVDVESEATSMNCHPRTRTKRIMIIRSPQWLCSRSRLEVPAVATEADRPSASGPLGCGHSGPACGPLATSACGAPQARRRLGAWGASRRRPDRDSDPASPGGQTRRRRGPRLFSTAAGPVRARRPRPPLPLAAGPPSQPLGRARGRGSTGGASARACPSP